MRRGMGLGLCVALAGAVLVGGSGCGNNKSPEPRQRVVKAEPQPQRPIKFEKQQYADLYPDDKRNVVGYPDIKPENNPRLLDLHAKAAAAAGAREDAMLYDEHFEGEGLSELGRNKIALMLYNAPRTEAVTVYVPSTGNDERTQTRVAAVERYFKGQPYGDLQIQVRAGTNPGTNVPANVGISGLRKLERGDEGGNPTQSGGDTTGGRSRVGSQATPGM